MKLLLQILYTHWFNIMKPYLQMFVLMRNKCKQKPNVQIIICGLLSLAIQWNNSDKTIVRTEEKQQSCAASARCQAKLVGIVSC